MILGKNNRCLPLGIIKRVWCNTFLYLGNEGHALFRLSALSSILQRERDTLFKIEETRLARFSHKYQVIHCTDERIEGGAE